MDCKGQYKFSIFIITGFLLVSMIASLVPSGFEAEAQTYGYSGGANQPLTINGLDGLQGFTSGENQVSLATHMVSQEQGRSYFEVVGFAISSPYSEQSTIYSLSKPMMGVFDTSANTMQIDMSQLAVSISGAGIVEKSNVYNVLRYDASIFIIDMVMQYQGTSGYQTMFYVTSISMIAPDGTVTAFTLDQPVQLIIDTMTYRMSVPTFPQFASTFNTFYTGYSSGYYTSVAPIIYQEPIYVTPVVYVPVYEPIPILVAPVFIAPIPISGPYFINTFTPNIYYNQFAIAAAAASVYAYGGDAFSAVQSIAPYVSGGGGYAFAAASAAAAAGVGGGGIAVAAASAAAAASGLDVSSAASAISTAVAGRGGASAAASAAAAAASGGADVGGIAASAAAAGAAATGGDPVLASNRIADRIDTPGARHAFETAREARQSGIESGAIAGRIGEAARRAGRQGLAGPEGRVSPGERFGEGAFRGPGAGQIGGPAREAGIREHGVGAGGAQPFSGITSQERGGLGRGIEGAGAARQAPISEFPAAAGGTTSGRGQGAFQRGAGQQGVTPFSGGITDGGIRGRAGAAPGQGITEGAGAARRAPISQFPAATGGGQGAIQRGAGIERGQGLSGGAPAAGGITTGAERGRAGVSRGQGITEGTGIARQAPVSQFPATTGGGQGAIQRGAGQGRSGPDGGTQFTSGAPAQRGAIGQGARQTPQGIQAQGGAQRAAPGGALRAPSGAGRQGISQGVQQAPTQVRSTPASRGAPVTSGGGIRQQAQGARPPTTVRSAPVSRPNVQSGGIKAPSGGGQRRSSSGAVKAPSSGGSRVSSGGSHKSAAPRQSSAPRSTGKQRK